jgi:hypothetical protein
MKITNILFVAILALLLVTFFQYRKIKEIETIPTQVDTVLEFIEIHDTIKAPGKIKFVKGETDTMWLTEIEYVPDPEHEKLLQQYMALGNKHFAKNTFETKFPIAGYGSATLRDTVLENKLIGSGLELDVIFPSKTITITKPTPPKREFYVGTIGSGTKENFFSGVSIGGLYKDKQDRIYGASVGVTDQKLIEYNFSMYIKLK